MKLAKRMLALAVAVMLVMAVLVVPASATLTPPFLFACLWFCRTLQRLYCEWIC